MIARPTIDCDEAASLVALVIDRELSAERNALLEVHLHECPACAISYTRARSGHDALRAALTRHQPTQVMRERVWRKLPGDALPTRGHQPLGRTKSTPLLARWLGLGAASGLRPLFTLAGACVLSATLAYFIAIQSQRPPQDIEIVTAHVRTLAYERVATITSDDRHTVKPWFGGKIDFAPHVADLSDAGFLLVGGTVELIQGRRVAAIAYTRRKHVIQLFVWPNDGNDRINPSDRGARGFNLSSWAANGLLYTAISDLNAAELATFRDGFIASTSLSR